MAINRGTNKEKTTGEHPNNQYYIVFVPVCGTMSLCCAGLIGDSDTYKPAGCQSREPGANDVNMKVLFGGHN